MAMYSPRLRYSLSLTGASPHGQEQEESRSCPPRLRRNRRHELRPPPQARRRKAQTDEVFAARAQAHDARGEEEVVTGRWPKRFKDEPTNAGDFSRTMPTALPASSRRPASRPSWLSFSSAAACTTPKP